MALTVISIAIIAEKAAGTASQLPVRFMLGGFEHTPDSQ